MCKSPFVLQHFLLRIFLHFLFGLRFQEIVPLVAGNIFGTEDNGPARKWIALVNKTLNSLLGTRGGCHTPLPFSDPIIEIEADFEGSMRQKTTSLLKIISKDGKGSCCDKVGLKKGRWTNEEDQILINYIQAIEEGSWRALPKNV
ncbi:hypothetical protein HN873_001258, partial [Arachis hypogaea]